MWRMLAVLLIAAFSNTGEAADAPDASRFARGHAQTAAASQHTYPSNWRARKIRRADGCWRGCQASAGRMLQACLSAGDTNGCVRQNDAADRTCLRACRIYGGPLADWKQ
jgi:hypothetical protein